jgi:hypothetical protein
VASIPPQRSTYLQDTIPNEGTVFDGQAAPDSSKGQVLLSNYHRTPDTFSGYTTIDNGGTDGDDIIHSPIPSYAVPKCLQTLIIGNTGSSVVPEQVDLVYIDFIEAHVARAVELAGLNINHLQDSDVYMPRMTLRNLITDWIEDNWVCDQA